MPTTPARVAGRRRKPVVEDSCDEHLQWSLAQWPEIDGQVEAIITRIQRADRYIERAAVANLEQVGLNHGEFKVLIGLIRGQRCPGDIARDIIVSTGTMTNRLDKLEEAGFVRRLPDPADRRGVLVEITPQGRDTLDRYIKVQARREAKLLGHLTPADKDALVDLLRKLLGSIEEETTPIG